MFPDTSPTLRVLRDTLRLVVNRVFLHGGGSGKEQ